MRGLPILVLVLLVLAPARSFAQGSITGVVRDSSGAVLPGVTVDASSSVLIEKVRTAVTDGNGQYRIVDLRAGSYEVTFSLPGFNTFRRGGIVIEGAFTATVNADMKVGSLQETVTVTAESPMVDVQSVRRQVTIDSELISALPAAKSYASLMQLMPNTVTQAGGAMDTQVVPGMVVFGGAGGRSNEGRLNIDGISVGSAFNGAGVSSYIADIGNAREVTMITSGGLGETEGGGPALNVLPREGGNSIRGTFYAAGAGGRMIGNNITQELEDRKVTAPNRYRKIWDFNVGVGGPILQDRLWFFGTVRNEGSERTVTSMFANANAGDPSKWTYVADTSRPAINAASYRPITLRLTAQATSKHKISGFWDEQRPCEGGAAPGFGGDACRTSGAGEIFGGSTAPPTPSASATVAPEASAYRDYGNRVVQAKWTAPMTNRLLVEASYGSYRSRWGGDTIPGLDTSGLIRAVEQCAQGCANNGGISNLTYRSTNWASNVNWNTQWGATMSFVTGTHNIKAGYQGAWLYDDRKNFTNSEFLQYRMNNGRPDQVTMTINSFLTRQRVRSDAWYVQEQWTRGRVTLQGALRYDHAWSYFPEQTVGPVRFFPTAVTYPETTGVKGYHDLWPRGGVAWDLLGTGKTSLKVNFGRYLEAAQNMGLFTALNPTARLSTTALRSWTDSNTNFSVDCNLLNPAAQNLSASGGDVCGANTNPNFGTQVFDSTLDPELLSGWGVRSGDWQLGASVQQEVLPRIAVEVGYQRRWLVNFTVTDNLARAPEDHTEFGINIPVDPRLPGGGGGVLTGLYNVTPTAAARLNDNFQTLSDSYGSRTQLANAINMNVTARPRFGLVLQGGFNIVKTDSDYCEIRRAVPEWTVAVIPGTPPAQSPVNPWCDTSTGWVSRFTTVGSYTVPRLEVQVAATIRSDQGGDQAALWVAPNSATVGLNRAFAGIAGQTITVNLIEPGTQHGDRVNQFDIRLAKIVRVGRMRANVGFDLYNVMNSAPVLTYDQSFVLPTAANPQGTWLRPTSVLQPRFAKFSVQVDF